MGQREEEEQAPDTVRECSESSTTHDAVEAEEAMADTLRDSTLQCVGGEHA